VFDTDSKTVLALTFLILPMNRTVMMTLGFLLIFAGIQLNVVDSYVMTPRMSRFLSDNFSNNQLQAGTETIASFGEPAVAAIPRPTLGFANIPNRVVRPPGWMGWAVMFLGAVFFLNGVIRR